ncbi:MAG TPA: hypothetical protein VLH37_09730 [Bacteroidales bacterium]|nr:hypothetical protein [Bacteroidales bacterium]
MKKLLFLAVVLIIAACAPRQDATTVEIAQLIAAPADFENQQVEITGVISHFCMKAGDKIKVSTADGAQGVVVVLGEQAAEFNAEMVGREITLTGLVKAADCKATCKKAEATCCQATPPAEGCCKQQPEVAAAPAEVAVPAEAAAPAAACGQDTAKVKTEGHGCAAKAGCGEKKPKVVIELATFELK